MTRLFQNAPMDACRFCAEPCPAGLPRFCPACGARLSGLDFDTLPACLVPASYIRRLRETEYEMADAGREGAFRRAQDHVIACEELNREVLDCGDRLREGTERDLAGLMTRGRAEELLDALPRDVPGLPDLRCALFTLVADLEQRQRLREVELLEDKAAKLSMFAADRRGVRRAEKAWQDVIFWLSRHSHPERDTLLARAQAELAALAARV